MSVSRFLELISSSLLGLSEVLGGFFVEGLVPLLGLVLEFLQFVVGFGLQLFILLICFLFKVLVTALTLRLQFVVLLLRFL